MRYFKLAVYSLVLLGAIGALVGYLFFRRNVPVQTRYIPRDAVLVLTVDVRELGLNLKGAQQLLPPRQTDAVSKQLAALTQALATAQGGGIRKAADIQLFLLRSGELAWVGAAVELSDSSKFGNFMRSAALRQEVILTPLPGGTTPAMGIDTSGTVAGWTHDAALLLFPVSHHELADTRAQLQRLLTLPESQSLAAHAAFCADMLLEFDASLWINAPAVTTFTQSAELAALFEQVQEVHLAADFDNGQLVIKRRQVLNAVPVPAREPVRLPAPAKNILGFWQQHANHPKHPTADYFFDEQEQREALAKLCTGSSTVFLHDTSGYLFRYFTLETDADFNTQQVEKTKTAIGFGITHCYTLRDPARVQQLLNAWVVADTSLRRTGAVVRKETGELPKYLWIDGNQLWVSTALSGPAKCTSVPPAWGNTALRLSVQPLLQRFPATQPDWPPTWNAVAALLAQHISALAISQPVAETPQLKVDELRLQFNNKELNAMIQLRDLLREAGWLLTQE